MAETYESNFCTSGNDPQQSEIKNVYLIYLVILPKQSANTMIQIDKKTFTIS